MKKTIFYPTLLFLFFLVQTGLLSNASTPFSTSFFLLDGGSGGSVSIESNALIANAPTNPSNVTVVSMDINDYSNGQLVHSWQGCNQSSCSYNIVQLPSGTYVAKAYFSNNTYASLVFVK